MDDVEADGLDGAGVAIEAVIFGLAAAAGAVAGPAAAGGLAAYGTALARVVNYERRERRRAFGRDLSEHISTETLLEALLNSAELRDLLLEAMEVAATTDWRAKRRLLARATAGVADGSVTIDEGQLLVRTVTAIDPREGRLLALLATPPPPEHREQPRREPETDPEIRADAWQRDELAEQLGDATLLDGMLAVLVGEGLIIDVGVGRWGGGASEAWGLSGYGKRFLAWLEEPDADQDP